MRHRITFFTAHNPRHRQDGSRVSLPRPFCCSRSSSPAPCRRDKRTVQRRGKRTRTRLPGTACHGMGTIRAWTGWSTYMGRT